MIVGLKLEGQEDGVEVGDLEGMELGQVVEG
jgi:hypothetical protein